MRDLYSDDYESVAEDGPDRLIPEGARRLAGAAVFLGLIVAMGLWSYRLGTRDAAEVPIVRAMEGPARVQPEDPGGLQAAHQGLEVNDVLAGHPAPLPREALPPAPAPAALAEEDGPQGELVLAAPPPLGEEAIIGDADLPMPAEEAPETLEVAALPEFAPQPAPELPLAPESAVAPDAPPATPDPAAGPRPRGRPANLAVARAPAPAAPTPAPVPTPVAAPAAAPAAPAAAPAAPAVREVSGLASGTRLVQLGAFDSEENARRTWSQLLASHGDLLGPKSLFVERTTSNARVFYRLRVAGFQDTEQTRVMCESLRARGVACIPVTLQ